MTLVNCGKDLLVVAEKNISCITMIKPIGLSLIDLLYCICFVWKFPMITVSIGIFFFVILPALIC